MKLKLDGVCQDCKATACICQPAPPKTSDLKECACTKFGLPHQYVAMIEKSAFEAERERANYWYEKFAKIEVNRASCCVQMEEERDALQAQLQAARDEIKSLKEKYGINV